MFIDSKQKRINIDASITYGDCFYPRIRDFPEIMGALGVVEIPDPTPPEDFYINPEQYYRHEIDDAPYVIYTRKSQETINGMLLQQYEGAIDQYLDKVANENGGWGDRTRLALRASYPGPYRELATAFGTWMDTVNHASYNFLQEVLADPTLMPESPEAYIASLPPFVPPGA